MERYIIGYRTPKYVVHREGEDRPVFYANAKVTCLEWIAIQMLSDELLDMLNHMDDELVDVTEEILIGVFRMNIENMDLEDPEGPWNKGEDYILSLLPAAFRRSADRLVAQYLEKHLDLNPPNPLAPKIHSV